MENPEGFARDLAIVVEDFMQDFAYCTPYSSDAALRDIADDYGVEVSFVNEAFTAACAEYREVNA